jgi:hypothetical protein
MPATVSAPTVSASQPEVSHINNGPNHFTSTSLSSKSPLANLVFQKVTKALQKCSKTIFVFDDADIFDPDAINVVAHFIEGSGRQLASNAVFIFVLNVGLKTIEEYARTTLMHAPEFLLLKRNQYQHSSTNNSNQKKLDLNTATDTDTIHSNHHNSDATNTYRKYWYSHFLEISKRLQHEMIEPKPRGMRDFFNSLVEKRLISYMVPFLPLEERDVSCCVRVMLSNIRQQYVTVMSRYDTTKGTWKAFKSIMRSVFEPDYKVDTSKANVGLLGFDWDPSVEYTLASQTYVEYVDMFANSGCKSVVNIINSEILYQLQEFDEEQLNGKFAYVHSDLSLRLYSSSDFSKQN